MNKKLIALAALLPSLALAGCAVAAPARNPSFTTVAPTKPTPTASNVATPAADGIVVVHRRVDVMVYLADASDETIKALDALGFKKSGEGMAVRLLVGSIDVEKLVDLVKVKAVVKVTPLR